MYLQRRNRILRSNASIRSLVAETVLTPNDFIAPLFIDDGENISYEIPSMPNYYRRSLDLTIKELKELSVQTQFQLAQKLAANCGYQFVAEDNEKSLEIKAIKQKIYNGYGGLPLEMRDLIIEGLESLLAKR